MRWVFLSLVCRRRNWVWETLGVFIPSQTLSWVIPKPKKATFPPNKAFTSWQWLLKLDRLAVGLDRRAGIQPGLALDQVCSVTGLLLLRASVCLRNTKAPRATGLASSKKKWWQWGANPHWGPYNEGTQEPWAQPPALVPWRNLADSWEVTSHTSFPRGEKDMSDSFPTDLIPRGNTSFQGWRSESGGKIRLEWLLLSLFS